MQPQQTSKNAPQSKKPIYFHFFPFRAVFPYNHKYQTFAKSRWYGKPLLQTLVKQFKAYDEQYYKKSVEEGRITINGNKVKIDYLLKNGDKLIHQAIREQPPILDLDIQIIYQDLQYLVVNKPPSFTVHTGGGFHYNTLNEILQIEKGYKNLFILHRLDRLTSGVIIFGKNKDKPQVFHKQNQSNQIKKMYYARVTGDFPWQQKQLMAEIECVSHKDGIYKVTRQIKQEENCTKTIQKEENQENEKNCNQKGQVIQEQQFYADKIQLIMQNNKSNYSEGNHQIKQNQDIIKSNQIKIKQYQDMISNYQGKIDQNKFKIEQIQEKSKSKGSGNEQKNSEFEQKNQKQEPKAKIEENQKVQKEFQQIQIRTISHNKSKAKNKPTSNPDLKLSKTKFKKVFYDQASDSSLVQCYPISGRTHQIRVHLQFLGHSILNDVVYGGRFVGNNIIKMQKQKQNKQLLLNQQPNTKQISKCQKQELIQKIEGRKKIKLDEYQEKQIRTHANQLKKEIQKQQIKKEILNETTVNKQKVKSFNEQNQNLNGWSEQEQKLKLKLMKEWDYETKPWEICLHSYQYKLEGKVFQTQKPYWAQESFKFNS